MKRFILIAGMCLMAQAGWAGESDRPKPRPALCRGSDDQRLMVCPTVFNASLRMETPRIARVAVPVAPQPDYEMPWLIGVFQ